MADEISKASMTGRRATTIVAISDGDGKMVPVDNVKQGAPVPYDYIDENGELRHGVRVIKPADQGKPGEYWWKLMLSDLLDLLEDISGKQTQALRAILDAFDPHSGIIITTQQELAERAGCSINVVNKVINLMKKHDLIRMPARGVYTINPMFMSQGGSSKFDALMIQYTKAPSHAATQNMKELEREERERLGIIDAEAVEHKRGVD